MAHSQATAARPSVSLPQREAHSQLTSAAPIEASLLPAAASLPLPSGAFLLLLPDVSLPPSADVLFPPLHAASAPPPPSYTVQDRE